MKSGRCKTYFFAELVDSKGGEGEWGEGPLLADAGVMGIAFGFGAQKLVSDLLSGFFYLVDGAFRVGEYIEAGSIKGMVENDLSNR